jgi:hypothetical protein
MLLSALIITRLPMIALAQGLSYTVPIFELDRGALDAQRRGYRGDAGRNEVLYCVEEWTTRPGPGYEMRTVIRRIRRAYHGGEHTIAGLESHCLDTNGRVLPTIHTHSDGNCQFSPADLTTVAARRAPFEGVQCGERHFIWTSSWQVIAISVGGDLLRSERPAAVPP